METQRQPTAVLTIKAALLAALVIVLSASVASADPAGNNGTVKVHSGSGETEPWVDTQNQPHVTCPFHMHFFFADAGQTGTWWLVSDDGVNQTGAAYVADANGMVTTGAIFMPAGHYSLNWQGSTETLFKQKTFWVEGECSGGPGG